MECEDCLTWYHIKCVNMGGNMYQVHMHHNSYTWVCFKCGLPNFTNSLIDLPEGIFSQVGLLADCGILYREINTLSDCQDLQKDINTLCNWESKWQMKFNIDKCYIMHVAHKMNPLLMTYNMNGGPIEVTASHTYLGISINNKLSWAEHISNTVSKVNKVLGLLRRSLYSCSPFVKETTYKSLGRPRLEYFSCIWDPTTRSNKISFNRFNVELQHLSVKILDAKAMFLTC